MADIEPSDGCQLTFEQLAAGASGPSLARVLVLVQAAALALDRYHARGAVHGELTPASFLVDVDDRVSLRAPDSSGPLPADADTYWSPQRRAGEPPRPSDDLYALGMIVVELLRSADAAAIDGIGPDGLGADADILLRPLAAWSPSERPASGAELVRVVHRAVAGAYGATGSELEQLPGPPRPHVEPPWAAASRVAQARRAHRIAQATPPRPLGASRPTQVRAPLGKGHYPDMPLPTVWVAAIVLVLSSVYLLPIYFMLFPAG